MAPKIVTGAKVLDIFQPGLLRGAEQMPFDPTRRYFYVEHPTEGWKVYLRSACIIHELYKPFVVDRFVIVKRTGGDPEKASWEPPKGQMEGKDGSDSTKTIYQLLRENIRREVAEEAKISNVRDLQHTGLVLQSSEPDYPANTYFQYHIFSGYVHPAQLQKAMAEFQWIQEHPAAFARMKRERREKDAIGWYSEGTGLMGKWSPTIVSLYRGLLG